MNWAIGSTHPQHVEVVRLMKRAQQVYLMVHLVVLLLLREKLFARSHDTTEQWGQQCCGHYPYGKEPNMICQ
jgi:hypothetical protein